jgi:hypothetical protein
MAETKALAEGGDVERSGRQWRAAAATPVAALLLLAEGEASRNEADGGGAEHLAVLRVGIGSTGPAGCHPAGIAGIRASRGARGLCAAGEARAQRGRRRRAG